VAAATSPAALPPALTGDSAVARRVRAALDGCGAGPVLVLVDEGLEPEAIARYLHDRSRPASPFVAVNCARPDPTQLEASLLGATGRQGRDLESVGTGTDLAAARGGTIFLAHAGELPAVVQRRLARLLRDGEALVDGRHRQPLDVFVIASAAPTIPAEAREGRFRSDLLRRFALVISIPPLHARRDDIAGIAAAVAAEVAAERRLPEAPRFTQAALTVLASLPWAGNVTELRAAATRILSAAPGPLIRQEDVLRAVTVEGLVAGIAPTVSLREARRRFEREYIAAVLEQHQWRMRDAARTLGLERANLYRKARQLGISRALKPSRPTPRPSSSHK
jgi:DNA-binding NtrC family response regulator